MSNKVITIPYFQSLNRHRSDCTSTGQGGDKRKRRWRERRGRVIIRGRPLFKVFLSKGVINQGTATIRGNTVL